MVAVGLYVGAVVIGAIWPSAALHAPIPNLKGVVAAPAVNHFALASGDPVIDYEPYFEPVDAAFAGLDPDGLARARAAVRRDVRREVIPGAALVLGRGPNVVEKRGIGVLARGLGDVDPDKTVYDLASLTKVVATTSAVMLLVEDGLMELDAPVSRYLPEFRGGSKARVTIRHLLTHTSGLPAGVSLPRASPARSLERLIATPLKTSPGAKVVYSDIGPIVLFAAAERVAGEPLSKLLDRRVFQPLGMRSTRFGPLEPCTSCAPTTSDIRGTVHDPLAQRLGGVAGNAGLFSTASDIGRFAAMLAGGGELGGVRIFREETVREFTTRQPGAPDRALGWEVPGKERSEGSVGELISETAFGHTGFTGTSLWIDPERKTWAVILSNRTYLTRGSSQIQALRRTVNDLVARAADLAISY